MKTLSAAVLVLFLAIGSLAGWRILSHSDTFVIGGEFVVPASQTVPGNLRALFAQIKLADGARVDGKITAISSTLDLAGSVGGSVVAIESDVIVRATAQLIADPQRVTAVPYVILLPRMLRTGYANALAQ